MRPILYFNGMFLVFLGLGMLLPLCADLYFGYQDWLVFFICFILTTFFGGSLVLGNIAPRLHLTRKQAFILANTTWVSLALFGALPFYMSAKNMSVADSFFESVSGLTSTGATVITDLDHTAAGVLLWRAMLQWMGGIITILMALSILPYLKVGGMHIFRTEFATEDKALPRTLTRSKMIFGVYCGLTLLCMMGYMGFGMDVFDALAHALTTISTGGFSTYDDSFQYFQAHDRYNALGLELVAVVFMIAGALPFLLYLGAVKGGFGVLLRDTQVRAFLIVLGGASVALFLYLMLVRGVPHIVALRDAVFNVVSIITGTGFVNVDYGLWGPFAVTFLTFLMVVGGCAGSTAGGIKIFRFQVLYTVTMVQIQKLLYPHAVHPAHFNGKPIPGDVPFGVLGFFFTYALCFCLLALGLAYTGLDFDTALSGALTALSNVGPGMGQVIGPMGNYDSLNEAAKLILCAGMILGRLELFIVLVLLSPYFWKP